MPTRFISTVHPAISSRTFHTAAYLLRILQHLKDDILYPWHRSLERRRIKAARLSSLRGTTMHTATRNTVDRLDKPSAYYLGKVNFVPYCPQSNVWYRLTLLKEQKAQIWPRRPRRTRENAGESRRSAERRYDSIRGEFVRCSS